MSLTKVSYSMIEGAVANVLDFGADPTGVTDSSTAIQAAVDTGHAVFFPKGSYTINAHITLMAGQEVYGEASGQFSSIGTTITNATVGDGVFWMTDGTGAPGQIDGPTISNFNLCADYPIKLNPETATIVDSGGTTPYIMKPRISNVTCTPRVSNVGTAISMSKVFDFIIERNNIFGAFDIGILIQGGDIGSIRTNRIIGFASYGILEISTGNFGSQNIIENNDILVGGANAIFIKSCSRHVRIIDNYCESATSVGAIDCTNIDCPTYGANTPATPQSIVVERNRIDGRANLTWVYRLDGNNPTTSTTLIDVGTTGLQGTPILVNGTYLPIRYGIFAYCKYDIRIPFSGLYENFQTGIIPKNSNGMIFNASNWNIFDNANMNSNNGADKIGYNGQNEIFCFPTLSGNTVTLLLPPPNSGTLNHPLTVGALYNVYVTARSPLSKTLICAYYDSTPLGGGSVVLTFAPSISTKLAFTVSAPAADKLWGINITGGAAQDCFIQSIEFRAVAPNPSLGDYANDAAAAAGGIAIGQQYRNGSVVQIRVT